jgi:hypothetical protein
MKDSVAALAWITNELTQRGIPFAVVGGLASNAYGGSRPLNDIDIDVPDAALSTLAQELEAYRTFGPDRSISECFDCQLLGFSYMGQEIELSGAESLLILDRSCSRWMPWPTDLRKIEERRVLGMTVPVMERSALIAYKELAGRETDLIDVSELRAGYNN